MESKPDPISEKASIVFGEVYAQILPYLDLITITNLLSVNYDFNEITNAYFKHFLINNKLIEPPQSEVPSDYYYKLFRSFYSRDILVASLSKIQDSYQGLIFARYTRCSTLGVKNFDLGTKFVVFHLYNNDMIFLRTEEYLDPKFQMKTISNKNIRRNVSKFFTCARHFYYLTHSGQLNVIFYDQTKPSYELVESTVGDTVNRPISDIKFSYNYAVIFYTIPKKSSSIPEEHKENQSPKIQEVKVWNIKDINPENLNSSDKLFPLQGLDSQPIVSFVVGNDSAYFVNEKGNTYELDFSELNSNKYKVNLQKALQNKNIKKLYAGYTFYFALAQESLPGLENWSQSEILDWVSSIGLTDFINIIKYENITGSQLVSADKEFLLQKLGVTREDIRIKFLTEIIRVSKPRLLPPKLYGWGNNSTGQLGLNSGNSTVHQPLEVHLPPLKECEGVNIVCGMKQTVFMTKGEVLITDIAKEVKKEEPPKDKGGKKKKDKGDKDKSEKDEPEKDKEVEKTKEKQGFSKWLNITPLFEKTLNRKYNVVEISINKDTVAILGANQGEMKKDQGGKFKGADLIFDRILWDKKLDKNEFTVGYEDRFLGILEVPFLDFAKVKDIPSHRIKYFKKSGEIVWDRAKKLNLL